MQAITLILESCKPGRKMNKQHRNTFRSREEEHPAASDDGLPGRGENVQTTASHAERPAADQVLVSYSELAEAGLLHLAVPRAPAARPGPENKQGLKKELWTRILRAGDEYRGAARLHVLLEDMISFFENATTSSN